MTMLKDWIEFNPKVKLEKDKSYPFVSMDVIAPGCRYVKSYEDKKFTGGGAKFCSGDTLFARITPCLENGKISQFVDENAKDGSFGSTEFFVLRAIPSRSIPAFVYYLSQTSLLRDTAIKSMVGASGRQRADVTVLRELEIEAPDLEIQIKIAEILSAYDDLIAINQRRIALLEDAARRLYREWFVHLRFPGHESVPVQDGVPQGWTTDAISAFGKIETGKTPPTSDIGLFGGDVPFIKTPDMHGRMVTNSATQTLSEFGSDSQKKKLLPAGSLLVSCIGTVGVVSIAGKPSHTNQQINAVIPYEDFYCTYLYFALSDLKEYMLGLGGGSTMANISKSKFSNLSILKPGNEILKKFEDIVVPSVSQIETLDLQNRELAQARDLLLPKLMSGQLDVSHIPLPQAPAP